MPKISGVKMKHNCGAHLVVQAGAATVVETLIAATEQRRTALRVNICIARTISMRSEIAEGPLTL